MFYYKCLLNKVMTMIMTNTNRMNVQLITFITFIYLVRI